VTVSIIPRSVWGARPWAQQPVAVAPRQRTHWFVHYDGGDPVTRTGYAIPRAIDDEHHARGWSGIGYNFVVDQTGQAYEGRGWDLVGAHCQGWNTVGLGVQVAIGGSQVPSDAAKATVRALYDEACDHVGRQLAMTWHGAHYPTDCPGGLLIDWVKAGMPAPATPDPQEDVVQQQDIEAIAERAAELTASRVWIVGWPAGTDPATGKPKVEAAQDRLLSAARGTALAGILGAIGQQLSTLTAQVDLLHQQLGALSGGGGAPADPKAVATEVVAELGALFPKPGA
jgi:hypothetical protein